MDCFNHDCPFRTNETSNYNRCECIGCPNRCGNDMLIISDHTSIEYHIKEQTKDLNYGI